VAPVSLPTRDERDAWANWPARVSAMIAAELEVDPHQTHTVLERHVRDHLVELAEVGRTCADRAGSTQICPTASIAGR
jgi:hypothetical protein